MFKLMHRVAASCVVVLGMSGLAIGLAFGVRQFEVYRYDSAYGLVDIGDLEQGVVRQLGKPHACPNPQPASRAYSIERFLVYRVGTKGRGGVTWTIGLDATGHVVTKHRDANGC